MVKAKYGQFDVSKRIVGIGAMGDGEGEENQDGEKEENGAGRGGEENRDGKEERTRVGRGKRTRMRTRVGRGKRTNRGS